MCSVVEKIKRESLEEGIALGEERGMKRGIKLGEERGVQRGTEKAKREIVQSMYKTQMPIESIAEICNLPIEKVRSIVFPS